MSELHLKPMAVRKMKPLVTVRIAGVAFKAAAGGRREQVLRHLNDLDQAADVHWLVLVTAGLIFGWGCGIMTAWWWL